jgi:hypothetical protein
MKKNKEKKVSTELKSLLMKKDLFGNESEDEGERRSFYRQYSKTVSGTATVMATSKKEAEKLFDNCDCDMDDSDDDGVDWDEDIEDSEE